MSPWEARLSLDQLRRIAGVVRRYLEDDLITPAKTELELNGMTSQEALDLLQYVHSGDAAREGIRRLGL